MIAQHSDFDVSFQEQVLGFMKEAEAEGQADPIDVAYLEDRVAVNRGERQTYGSQIRCDGGEVVAATPIRDEGSVDRRRRDVGLEPLEDYFAELEEIWAAEAMAT